MRSVTQIDQEIGRRIQQARKRSGVSMRELGLAITVSVQQMQKYEAGVNRISAGNIVMLARTLGVDVRTLLGTEEETGSAFEGDLSGEALRLARSYDTLPAGALKQALRDAIRAAAQDA